MFLNKMQIIARLTHTPIIRTTNTGVKVADLSLANNEKYKNAGGETVEKQYYYKAVAWRGIADIIERYAIKGQEVYIEGKLCIEEYDGRDGSKKKKTYIMVDVFQLGQKPLNSDRPTAAEKQELQNDDSNFEGAEDEEIRVENIPF